MCLLVEMLALFEHATQVAELSPLEHDVEVVAVDETKGVWGVGCGVFDVCMMEWQEENDHLSR